MGSDSCTGDFEADLGAASTGTLTGEVWNCTLSGPLAPFGNADSALQGTYDTSGNVSGTFDDLGSIAFTGSANGTTFSASVSDSFTAATPMGTVSATVTASMTGTKTTR